LLSKRQVGGTQRQSSAAPRDRERREKRCGFWSAFLRRRLSNLFDWNARWMNCFAGESVGRRGADGCGSLAPGAPPAAHPGPEWAHFVCPWITTLVRVAFSSTSRWATIILSGESGFWTPKTLKITLDR